MKLPVARFLVVLFGCVVLLLPGLFAAKTKPDAEEKIELPKMTVNGRPICSYGIAISALREPSTRKIKRLFIKQVIEDSTAARQGLQAGDEIISINGRNVAGMDGTMKLGGELFDLLVDRPPLETAQFEVVVRSTKIVTLKAGL